MAAYRVLCEGLGRAARFSLSVPKAEDATVDVRWACGCVATGADLRHVALVPCATHATHVLFPSQRG